MNNAFDSDNYPDQVPDELVAGNRWAWTRSDITAAYPTTLYTLKFRLVALDDSGAAWEITASKTDSAHVVEVSQANTAGYTAGEYKWQAVVVRDSDSEEVTVDTGLVMIVADLGADSVKASSWAYQILTAIRAVLQGAASDKHRRIEINGRTLESRSYAELMGLEKEFSKRWEAEKAEINRKAGRSTGRRVLVKMSA